MPLQEVATDPATWYLGPVGNMWPIFCPEPGVAISNVRYGGIHQGLSGKRTLDITGYQYEYRFKFNYLNQEDFEWFEMLHTRGVPGPFKLLNPMKKNRLSQQASVMQVTPADNEGISFGDMVVHTKKVRDWPAEASQYGTHCLQAFGWGDVSQGILFDHAGDMKSGVPVFDGERVVCSVYVKHLEGDQTFEFEIDFYRADGSYIGSSSLDFEAQSTWDRFAVDIDPADMPEDCAKLSMSIFNYNTNSVFNIAAPQIESEQMTSWEIGGAAPTVIMNQLPLKSPRFPLRNAQMTLLEA